MSNQPKIAGYIMAGGGSTRFGVDKALVEFGGRRMLARTIELMRGVAPELKIVGPAQKYAEFGVETVADRWPGEGPLGGIITALLDAAGDSVETSSHHPSRVTGHESPVWCLMVSCDMPFLTQDWLKCLVERAKSSAADVVLPRSASGLEPLCACWRTGAVETLHAAFERGIRKVMDGVAQVKAEVLDVQDWKQFDSEGRLFWNMNTEADYKEALRVLKAGGR